jgi:mannose-6-phosphate isomerase-like protein (cupin superfamily)
VTASGVTLDSPTVGQSLTFLRTSADTDGEELLVEARMRPGSKAPSHRHLHQEERFSIVSGTGRFVVARKQVVAGPGDVVIVPAGVAHGFRNASRDELHVRITWRPAMRTEDLLERMCRLDQAGQLNKLGAPAPRVVAALIREFPGEFFYLSALPVGVQRLLARALR